MKNLMSNFSGLAMSRMEMKKVTGGCCIYYREKSTGAYSGRNCGFSVSHSQYYYQNKSEVTHNKHTYVISGYCCASC
jgi:hypothetical protein